MTAMSEDIKDKEIIESTEQSAADDSASIEQVDEALLSFEQADGEADAESEEDEGIVIHDADAEDALEEARLRRAFEAQRSHTDTAESDETETPHNVRGMAEMMAIIEALIFVAEEPLSVKALSDVL